jgi:hypothetical protein
MTQTPHRDDDVERRLARIRDDFVQLHAHTQATIAPVRLGPAANTDALGRVQYMEGSDAPVVYYDWRLPAEHQLWILEAAYQVMLTGGPDLKWGHYEVPSGEVLRRYRYFDITPEWLAVQPR